MNTRKNDQTPAGLDLHDDDEVLEGYIITDSNWPVFDVEDDPDDVNKAAQIQATGQDALIESVSDIEKVQAGEAEQTSKKLETMSTNINRLNSLLRR